MEGKREEELVIPQCWVMQKEKQVLWPRKNAETALKNMEKPAANWKKFPLVKIKVVSGNMKL